MLMILFYFKIPAGYKNMTNCLMKITFLGGIFLWHVLVGA